jgi:hypothetical protein
MGISIVLAGGMMLKKYYRPVPYHLKRVATFEILHKNVATYDSNTLVIFDVHNVLLTEAHAGERGFSKERKQAATISTLFRRGSLLDGQLDAVTKNYLWSRYAQALEEQLIDPTIPHLISQLQKQGVKVIALTRFLVGCAGRMPIEDIRIAKLKAVGIDFRSAFPEVMCIEFPQFSYEGKVPKFKAGILFTSYATTKGALLTAFLNTMKWYPKKVVMFDDRRRNLVSVGNALAHLSIPFEGYEYTGAAVLAKFFDREVAEFQMYYLIEHGKWLTPAEARQMIEKR